MNAGLKTAGLLVAAGLLGSCGYLSLSFRKPLSPDEIALEQEVRGFYTEIGEAFATGNSNGLMVLFSPSITHPMTQDQIKDWANKFFTSNGRARFHILSFDFDELARERAVVTLKYQVETPNGRGDFGGTETDTLERREGRWYIKSWDKD